MVYQRQRHGNDCGPACLVMLASCYQVSVDLPTVRRICKVKLMGTTLEGLLTAAMLPKGTFLLVF
ncbi:MAG: hypothetical protein LBQ30_02660 [Treponema sp.]|jgi:ABC-type bacteriocin/lantibiotic exporter with double-glycine peptidase domain|nr:hypothetical protein [Treponema sp.]